MNIVLVPDPNKADAVAAAERLRGLLEQLDPSARVTSMPSATTAQLAAFKPDLAVVLGGDGAILYTAQAIGQMQVPVAGINFGKLGYLAAFSYDQFVEHLRLILTGKTPRTQRLRLEGGIYAWDGSNGIAASVKAGKAHPRITGLALNDVVINAGDPFRMLDLEAHVDGEVTTTFRSDGVIVSTASGSTGYNLSAGGPLVAPGVEAMVLTPICPHTLSFRPVVLPATSTVVICFQRLNPGTKVSFDGQVTHAIRSDECLVIRQAKVPLTLIENPSISHWQMLARKLHWAQNPGK